MSILHEGRRGNWKKSHRNSEILYICSKILPKTGKYITLIRNIFLFRVKGFYCYNNIRFKKKGGKSRV